MSRLKRFRQKARLTQVELSQLSGVSQSAISRLESQSVTDASFSTLEDLAAALRRRGVSVEAKQLQPRRQPLLIKGAFAQPRRKKGAAA
jgi:transcriptional regulator with XRE-family HTH domain